MNVIFEGHSTKTIAQKQAKQKHSLFCQRSLREHERAILRLRTPSPPPLSKIIFITENAHRKKGRGWLSKISNQPSMLK
jgi:hypothetical protein